MKDYPAYAIDIDLELRLLEKYFEMFQLPKLDMTNLRFVPTLRYPVSSKDLNNLTYDPTGYIRNTPYMPFRCLSCVNNYVLSKIYMNSQDYKLFIKNPMLSNSKNFLENCYIDDDDPDRAIIIGWLQNERITISDFKNIRSLLEKIMSIVRVYTDPFPNHIWRLDYSSSSFVILYNDGEIKAFRYTELLNSRR